MKVTVDGDMCTGCEDCVNTVPAVFEMDEDEGVATAKVSEVPADQEDAVKSMADDCPASAIEVA